MTVSALATHSWTEIARDAKLNWFVYLSMPIVAAFVGYITKVLALQMLYRPLEFVGVGPIGWQGVIPRRAGKMASLTIQMLTESLLRPEELLDKIDAQETLENLREPLTDVVDDVGRELAEKVRPGLWDLLPAPARRAVVARVHASASGVVDNLIAEMKADMPRFIDLQYMAVTILVKNKAQLNKLVQTMGGGALKFIRRSGIYFGFAIGLVQMVAWGIFHDPWIMPAFGFFTGFASDWLALNVIFIPRTPRKLLDIIPVHGVLHQQREQVTRDYAHLIAADLFSPEALLDAILHGPTSERIFAAVEREIYAEIDKQAGVVQPLITLAIGTERYRAVKDSITQTVLERLPETMQNAAGSAGAFDIESLIVDKMSKLTPIEYENILRPIFKDDEMLMVVVGAVLDFLIGELQVVVVEHLSR